MDTMKYRYHKTLDEAQQYGGDIFINREQEIATSHDVNWMETHGWKPIPKILLTMEVER